MKIVIYKEIPDYPGYSAGSDGSIWSHWQFVGAGYGGQCKYVISDNWKQLKGAPRPEDGRLRYTLRRSDGKYIRKYGAHFVLSAFVGPRPDGAECCHKDDVCTNDAADNLRWGTRASNEKDKKRNGRTLQGVKHHAAKLNDEAVANIRRIGKPLRQHAEKYGVTVALVGMILKGKIWQHVK